MIKNKTTIILSLCQLSSILEIPSVKTALIGYNPDEINKDNWIVPPIEIRPKIVLTGNLSMRKPLGMFMMVDNSGIPFSEYVILPN
jgi:hypothetical protein